MNAKNKEQYLRVWKVHVRNLNTLRWVFSEEGCDKEAVRIMAILEELDSLIERAADIEFKDQPFPEAPPEINYVL